MKTIKLKAGREKSLLRRHPWIFTGAIASQDRDLQPGETVDILTSHGDFCARAAFSPQSQIAARVWTFDVQETVDARFLGKRIARAVQMRADLPAEAGTTVCRLVNSESDGLPGLVVDRYGEFLVCQFSASGVERWKTEIVAQLQELAPCKGIYDRSDLEVRAKEGLASETGLLAGEEPPEFIEIREGDLRYLADVRNGHKTGFYLDQRENRIAVTAYSPEAEVLNCFAYTGGFGVATLHAGASHVTNVESSAPSLALAKKNAEMNKLHLDKFETIAGDVFAVLRQYRAAHRQFDLIILDPPKFVDSRSQLLKATRAYKDINLLAFKLLRPGGILLTFSCSGLLSPELFQKIVADAALDAGREAQMLQRLSQAPDHPTLLSFPEGSYLKGLVCRVVS